MRELIIIGVIIIAVSMLFLYNYNQRDREETVLNDDEAQETAEPVIEVDEEQNSEDDMGSRTQGDDNDSKEEGNGGSQKDKEPSEVEKGSSEEGGEKTEMEDGNGTGVRSDGLSENNDEKSEEEIDTAVDNDKGRSGNVPDEDRRATDSPKKPLTPDQEKIWESAVLAVRRYVVDRENVEFFDPASEFIEIEEIGRNRWRVKGVFYRGSKENTTEFNCIVVMHEDGYHAQVPQFE